MVFPMALWVVLAIALVVSAIGFKKYVWFISLGYGFSIAAEGIALLVLLPQDALMAIGCALFIA